jgi:hypothetical protein
MASSPSSGSAASVGAASVGAASVGAASGSAASPPLAAAPLRGVKVLRLWSLRSSASRRSADSSPSMSEPSSPARSSPQLEEPERVGELEGKVRALERSSAEASELCAEQGARLRELGLELEQVQHRGASLEAALCRERDELLQCLTRCLFAAATLALALALELRRRGLDVVAQCGALALGALLALAAEAARRRGALPLPALGPDRAAAFKPRTGASADAGSLVKPAPRESAGDASSRRSSDRSSDTASTSTTSSGRSASRPGLDPVAVTTVATTRPDKSEESAFTAEYKLITDHYLNFFEGLYSKVEELPQFQEMSEEQRAVFYKLRNDVADQLPQSIEVDWSKHHIMPDDATVLRFLQADKYSAPHALERLAKTVAWMQRMQLNAMVRDQPARLAQYRRCRSRIFLGFDLAGRPVHAERIGEWVSGLASKEARELTNEDWLSCYTYEMGQLIMQYRESVRRGTGHWKQTFIADVRGLRVLQALRCVKLLQSFSKDVETRCVTLRARRNSLAGILTRCLLAVILSASQRWQE